MSIFGPPLHELTLDDVQAYLNNADVEPLLWEAKGTQLDKKAIREQICGFANSHEGGYLILGASERGGAWVCDGVTFRDPEPATWIVNLITDQTYGLRPRPDIDFSPAFDTHNGRRVLVVRIAPISTPPCIVNGTVFERLPGQTPRVKDPRRLAELFRRGDDARRRARQSADRAAEQLLTLWLDEGAEQLFAECDDPTLLGADDPGPADCVRVCLAVSATGYRPDISSRLFQDSLVEDLWENLRTRDQGVPSPFGPQVEPVRFTQEAAAWRCLERHPVGRITVVRATWDGAVAVGRVSAPGARYPDRLIEALAQEWALADRVTRENLGGSGEMYVTVIASGRRLVGPHVPDEPVVMKRGPLEPGVHESVVDGLARELSRAVGNYCPEPPAG